MSTSIFIKVFSDCCLCLSFVSLVAVPNSSHAPLLVTTLLCALAASAASALYGKHRIALSRLCCLVPLLSLFAAGDRVQLLTMLIPIIYTGIIILRGMLYLEYYAYRRYVITTSILLLIAFVFAYISAPLINYSYRRDVVDTFTFLGFGAIHVLSGFFLLRRLRIGSDGVARRSFRSLTVIAASAAVLGAVGWATDAYFSKLLHAFESLVGLIYNATRHWVFDLMWNPRKRNPTQSQPSQTPSSGSIVPTPSETPSVSGTVPPDTTATIPEPSEPQGIFGGLDLNLPEPDTGTILLVILGLILLVALVLMVLSFRARSQEVVEREIIVPLKGRGRKSKKAPLLSNRAHVRQLYRTFLRQEIRRGMILQPSDTSEDVLQKLHEDADPESAAALRKIYIQARYDQSNPVSHEQVEKAKEALRHLQSDKNTAR